MAGALQTARKKKPATPVGMTTQNKTKSSKSKSGWPLGWPLFFAGVGEPAKIGAGAGGDREDQEFGDVVGVEAEDFPFEGFEAAGGGFDQEEMFAGGFDFAFPAVDGFDGSDLDVDAGGQVFLEEGAGDCAGFGERGAGYEDQAELGGGRHWVGGKIVVDLEFEEKKKEKDNAEAQRRGRRRGRRFVASDRKNPPFAKGAKDGAPSSLGGNKRRKKKSCDVGS